MTTPDEIREDIELHRAELAQTVDLLADQLHVKANVKATAAKKVEPLRKLLEARTQLSNLMTYMDGKTGAEELISKVMQDPALLKSLAAAPKAEGEE